MTSLAHFRLPILAGGVLALLLLLVCAEPAVAGISGYFTGLARRDRVIQVCVVVALLALFILMKKFSSREDG
jgi:hypothetical protein